MKKRGLITVFIAAMMFMLAGCEYKKDYIKIYDEELEAVFGEYEYEALGEQYNHGFDGLGSHTYYAWEITYTDATGAENVFKLCNNEDFDFVIGQVYKENVQALLKETLLAECIEAGSINNTNCYITFLFNLNDYYYEEDANEIINGSVDYIKDGDYEHFNIASIDCEKLIEDGIVTIQKLEFRVSTSHDTPPIDSDIEYFKALAKDFEEIIPVEQAYYMALYTDYNEDDIISLKEE